MCTSIENLGDRSEVFLAGCVPDLEFDNFVLDFDQVKVKLNANGDHPLHKLILDQSFDRRWFTTAYMR